MRLVTTVMALLAGCLTAGLHVSAHSVEPDGKLVLWYDKPASQWNQALPIGNGRLGGMVFGGVEQETITINEGNRSRRMAVDCRS